MNLVMVFQNLEDSTQACNDLLPFYTSTGAIRYADPDGIQFLDGSYGVQSPANRSHMEAITVPFYEEDYDILVERLGRYFPPGDI